MDAGVGITSGVSFDSVATTGGSILHNVGLAASQLRLKMAALQSVFVVCGTVTNSRSLPSTTNWLANQIRGPTLVPAGQHWCSGGPVMFLAVRACAHVPAAPSMARKRTAEETDVERKR